MSSRVLCTSYQSQENTVLCNQLPIPEEGTLLPIASWYWTCQEKHTAVKHWMEQYFTYIKKDTARSASIVCIGPPWPPWLLKAGQFALCSPLCGNGRNQQWGWQGALRCTHFKQRQKNTTESGKGKQFPQRQ